MQIKKKLPLITVLLVIMPLLLVNSLFYYVVSSVVRGENEVRLRQLLHTEMAYLEQFFEARRVETEYLADNYEIQKRMVPFKDSEMPSNKVLEFSDTEAINDYLKGFSREKNYIRDAFMISNDGLVVGSSNPGGMMIDLSDRAYYQIALSGETTISNLLVERVDGDFVFFVATPIREQNSKDILGVFATIIDLDNISETLMQLVSSEFDSVYLLDSQSNIVFHSDASKIGKKITDAMMLEYFSKNNLSELEEGDVLTINGEDIFVIYHEMDKMGWKLIAEQKLSQVNATTRELGMILILGIILANAVTVVIIIRFTRTITNPISGLIEVMDSTAKGNLGVRAQYTEPNELGQLSKHFNEMLDELVGTYEILSDTNDRLLDSEQALKEKINALELSEHLLRQIQGKHTRALESASDIIWEWYPETGETYFSRQWYTLLEGSGIEVKKDEFFAYSIIDKDYRERLTRALDDYMTNVTDMIMCEFKTTIGAPPKWCILKGKLSLDEESGRRVMTGILGDITIPKQNEAKIRDLAFVDQLTRLPNRTAFNLELNALIHENTNNLQNIALCMMDIDDFKTINDRFGHSVGDQIIEELSTRFLEVLEKEDKVNIYRVSGDEFAFVITDFDHYDDIIIDVKKIYECLADCFYVEDHEITVLASMGIAVYPEHGHSSDLLVQNADTAVYRAKEMGKGKYVFFEKKMSDYIFKKYEIEKALQVAVTENLVYMVYQPQYDVHSDKIIGYEALMRMGMKDGQMISPLDFIPIAEETGSILEIGAWSIQHVCGYIKKWQVNYGFSGTIAVNVSGVQLKQPGFADQVAKMIEETEINTDQLVFEITESIFMETNTTLLKQLEALKRMGIKLSLDDFGTGYSSFSYLRMLPLYSLKIDKSFVDFIGTNPKDASLVRQMIEIAHELDLSVVAEGVEDEKQFEMLKHFKCDRIQGYLISRPIGVERVEQMLRK
jgi:diguanylate cyclase (GGDEF)-like protein